MRNNIKRSALAIALAVIVSIAMLWAPLSAVNVSAASKPGKTKVTVLSNSSTSIMVKWKKVSKVKGYIIYRATGSKGKFKKVKTITKSSTTSWKNTNLKKGKHYYYKIKTYKESGRKTLRSGYSNKDEAMATSGPYYKTWFALKSDASAQSSITFMIQNKCTKYITMNQGASFMSDKDSAASSVSCYRGDEPTAAPGKTTSIMYQFGDPYESGSETLTADFIYGKSALYLNYSFGSLDTELEMTVK